MADVTNQQFKISWIDAGKEPQCPPNPSYPDGIDLDASGDAEQVCTAQLPYPAKRIGYFHLRCGICGRTAACTTAGRPDDPRSIKLACKSLRRA